MTPAALDLLFEQQYQASRRHIDVPWEQRQQRLQRLARLVEEGRAELAEAIAADFGRRSVHETELLEVFPTLAGIRHALKHGRRWMQARRVATDWWFWPARNRLWPQPLGVVGIVAPWNYPLYLTAGPLTAALAAGNRAMVKVSEAAPAFAQWLAEAVSRHFAADEVAVVCGDANIAAAFCRLPFDHLLFTGSSAVGRQVMAAAAANLTPVTLELGGKSPALLLADADLDRAVARIMSGKLLNAGQTCIAPDYVLLPENRAADFIARARRWVAAHYPDLAANPDYSHIINAVQRRRLQQLLQEAAAAGAELIPLAAVNVAAGSTLMPPYLVRHAPAHSRLLQEEIFGPVLPILGYTDLDAALATIRARPRPLALYVFGRDAGVVEQVLRHTVAGGVCVNDTLLHAAQENLPFGGVGASGMGAYHGRTGFDALSHLKPVFTQARINAMPLLTPPYGRVFAAMLALLRRSAGRSGQ